MPAAVRSLRGPQGSEGVRLHLENRRPQSIEGRICEGEAVTPKEIAAIRARLEAVKKCAPWGGHGAALWATKATAKYPKAAVWYGDGDQCAEVHGNLALEIDGDAVAEFFAHSIEDIERLLAALNA